jgi:hypothetical protein
MQAQKRVWIESSPEGLTAEQCRQQAAWRDAVESLAGPVAELQHRGLEWLAGALCKCGNCPKHLKEQVALRGRILRKARAGTNPSDLEQAYCSLLIARPGTCLWATLSEANEEAWGFVCQHWTAVTAVAEALMQMGTLDGDEIHQIVNGKVRP